MQKLSASESFLHRESVLSGALMRGVWNVLNADPEVILTKDPEHLWEELSRMARAIMADGAKPLPVRPISARRNAPAQA